MFLLRWVGSLEGFVKWSLFSSVWPLEPRGQLALASSWLKNGEECMGSCAVPPDRLGGRKPGASQGSFSNFRFLSSGWVTSDDLLSVFQG